MDGFTRRPVMYPARRPLQLPRKEETVPAQTKRGAVAAWLRKNHLQPRDNQLYLLAASLLLLTIIAPVIQQLAMTHRYRLSQAGQAVVGKASEILDQKLKYDPGRQLYHFNQDGLTKAQAAANPKNPVAKLMAAQLGGENKNSQQLYSLDLPENLSSGITVYDNNTGLSFKLVPDFGAAPGKMVDGHLVYPIDGGQLVYSLKGNGLKEDVLLNQAPKNGTFNLSYHLQLPAELEAKALDDGGIGIYSADPSLYGNISYGDPGSQAAVMQARKNGDKTNLVFGLPAPSIKQNGAGEGQGGNARFIYKDNRLQLAADHLQGLQYPLSLDPSVVITSDSDFAAGNNEGSIDFPSGQINRGGLTGGSTGSWASSTSFTTIRNSHASAVYNGYLYVLGGYDNGTNYYNDVQYALICTGSNSGTGGCGATAGTIGTWNSTTSFITARKDMTAVAYDGYIYLMGGNNASTSTYYNDVQYAPINTNGTLGAWHYTHASTDDGTTFVSGFTNPRSAHTSVAYNGYLYVIGGNSSGPVYYNDVQYAQINANGTIGAWNTTTSFTTARSAHTSVAYNGYLYVIGGSGGSDLNDVQYAPINSDGTVGTWHTTTSFTTARTSHASVVYNGYLYIIGGVSSGGNLNDTQYAQINANGTLGAWNTTSTFTNARFGHTSVAYNGYLYVIGGTNNTVNYNDTQYAKIDPAGVTTDWNSTTSLLGETTGGKTYSARQSAASVAYNGYLYVLGGFTGSPASHYYNSVIYAPINSNGTIGTWVAATSFTTARIELTAVAYNGYLYILGGTSSGGAYLNDVQYAPINSNGTLGTWVATTSFSNGRSGPASAAYNGYLYIMGGSNGFMFNDVQYALICTGSNSGTGGCGATAGTTGTWHYTHNSTDDSTTFVSGFNTARYDFGSVAYGGYLYILGGWHGTNDTACNSTASNTCSDVQFAPINSNGTIGTWHYTHNSNDDGTTFVSGFNTARYSLGSFVYNGYLYVAGGGTSLSSYANDVQFAPINSNGTVGTWKSTKSFSTARSGLNSVIYNGYAYVIGGFDGTNYDGDVQYAQINNGGSGVAGSWTTLTGTPMPYNANSTGLVFYNGFLYMCGGQQNGTYHAECKYVAVNQDGTLGTWTATSSLNVGRGGVGMVQYNGYMYIAGGYTSSSRLNDVQYAPINSNGTLGTWHYTHNSTDDGTTFVSGFTSPRDGQSVLTYNGYLYVLGGEDGTNRFSDVQYAPINANGTIGTWNTTTSLPFARDSQSAVINNGYIYVLGGFDGTNDRDTVQYALICTGSNSGTGGCGSTPGTIGTWNTTTSFNIARSSHDSFVYNGYVYILGGGSATSDLNDVQYAPINANGTLGKWQFTTSFTGIRFGNRVVAHNGYAYTLGGFHSPTGPLNDVQYAPLTVMQRKGYYSKLIDLGGTTTLSGFSYNGTLANGLNDIAYTAWAGDGITVNGSGTAFSLTAGGKCGTGGTQARYVFVRATLDDSRAASFPDASGADSNLQDLTVTYDRTHPLPTQRLHLGKTLQTGVLSALDTCGV